MAQIGLWRINLFLLLILSFFVFSCEDDKKQEKQQTIQPEKPIKTAFIPLEKPNFSEDSAYLYVQQQVDFGPRFPNNEAHGKCAIFLKNKLASFGFSTQIQEGKATTFNNKNITIKNIIGTYNPAATKRILLFAHWDTRPFADHDDKDRTKPILGANDGASGVGILLEVARQINITQPEIGIDIIFFDAEDYGQPSSLMSPSSAETWCLGSQYWARNPHIPGYKADFGILLDMVGGPNPQFTKESISMRYAPNIVRKVWDVAKRLGHQHVFVDKETYFVGTDDHQFVNEIANIPSIDIIHFEESTGAFHQSWHTHDDNMDIIEKTTLKIVGETILGVIYNEK
ncbi:MAG: M28 family peptidase [Vicingaceae bacterium]|nr:M28 family peptidase [Vicingaceae bacterium]